MRAPAEPPHREYAGEADASEEEPVTDEYYSQLELESYEAVTDGDFMFEKAGQVFSSDNFSGDVWASTIIDGKFAHIAVNTNPDNRGVTWYDRISEAEYAALIPSQPQD